MANTERHYETNKKIRAGNESFQLIGQPDVQVGQIKTGKHQARYRVSVHGFNYHNTKTGGIDSGGLDKIAVWLLDTDQNRSNLFPRQVFFLLAAEDEGCGNWGKMSDEERKYKSADEFEHNRCPLWEILYQGAIKDSLTQSRKDAKKLENQRPITIFFECNLVLEAHSKLLESEKKEGVRADLERTEGKRRKATAAAWIDRGDTR